FIISLLEVGSTIGTTLFPGFLNHGKPRADHKINFRRKLICRCYIAHGSMVINSIGHLVSNKVGVVDKGAKWVYLLYLLHPAFPSLFIGFQRNIRVLKNH